MSNIRCVHVAATDPNILTSRINSFLEQPLEIISVAYSSHMEQEYVNQVRVVYTALIFYRLFDDNNE
jgi:hypothetical protein